MILRKVFFLFHTKQNYNATNTAKFAESERDEEIFSEKKGQ